MDVAIKTIEAEAEGLRDINKKIHENPELGFEEVQAHDNIVAYLRKLGFKVKPHAYGVATSMEAEYGSGGRVVTFNAEYDSLPDIGHACGHNLIATASVAGFIGAAAALKASGKSGRVRLLGTPAEEGGGGKLKLIDAGAFKDVDACMMVHPAPFTETCKGLTGAAYATSAANCKLYVTFHGRPAHAAFAPWQGSNALDAATLAYSAVSMMRQQIRPEDRIHSIINHGGDRPNVVPHMSKMNYYCRAPTLARAKMLRHRVEACFRAAGLATNCHVEIQEQNTYFDLRPNRPLAAAYAEEMEKIGSPVALSYEPDATMAGSTDQGNVSYECPSIHPMFGIDAREGCYNHTPGFTAAAGTEKAFWQTIETAKGMAAAAWRMLTDDKFAEEVKKDFEEDQKTLRKENSKT
ncbi:metal-dependent amidase/aminoacylase/carboxypeptidase [Rhizodiscina lignyota]|uniref:Peptidase M20 domain-containing protein 2 n=1 Tax=Rhizodiscina lignyota TaxID=1504668 RepID=A0A9P4IK07_9PEZI|nr:metal-dependent amidase/aminoacylase/carboxypeptidase [Rhizodiscina lignyota]